MQNLIKRNLVFIGILFLIGCTEGERSSSGNLTEEQSIKIKEYVVKQIRSKNPVDIKGVCGTNLRGLKLTSVNLSGVDLSGVDLSES